MIRYLHKSFDLTSDDVCASDNYALDMACTHGHIAVVKYLHVSFNLTHADILSGFPDDNPLLHARNNGHTDIVNYLTDVIHYYQPSVRYTH